MEPPDIHELDEQTVQRIAAGEVVERPASVVKELIENSLDADASRIAVAVESGGTAGIRVRDDGVGIPADQLEAAVAEHATSKIATIDDLDHGVGTLGFRGEALYTVSAVSRLTVRSRPPDADAGAEITVEGGDVGAVRPAGCPAGTTVEVTDLFYNTPARKKFLKQTATEFDHVNTVVRSYALANPDVAVSLEHDGRETFATEGNSDLRSAVLAVYGREVAESMIDVSWSPAADSTTADAAGDEADTPVRSITGLVSHPETTRSTREYLTTYVNGRYVTASVLRDATLDAYGGQLAPDRFPFAVLFIEVPPGDVDVNVHPRKLEVRFDEEPVVRRIVEEAVDAALLDHGLIRSTAPRGRSAPDETEVRPESPPTEAVGGAGTPHEQAAADRRSEPEREDGPAADRPTKTDADVGTAVDGPTPLDPADDDAWVVGGLGESTEDTGEADKTSADTGAGNASNTDDDRAPDSSDTRTTDTGAADDDRSKSADTGATDTESPKAPPTANEPRTASDASTPVQPSRDPPDRSGQGDPGQRNGPAHAAADASRLEAPTAQRTLDGEKTTDERTYDSLPTLRVLGQLHETYVVAEAPDGLVLIDQHAADERVNYERLQSLFEDGVDAQALANPVSVQMTAREAALFDEFVDELATVGFRAERGDDREVVVKAVPAVFDSALEPDLLRDVLSAFVGDATAGDEPITDVIDELLADLACYPSVTGNTSLTEGRVVDLLDRLDDCANPYACPHGRPVVIRVDREEIGSRFERDYPGHAGRRRE